MKSNRSKKLHGDWRNNDVESLVESFRLNDLSEVESFFFYHNSNLFNTS